MSDEVLDALYRKAVGYTAEEEIREYGNCDELIKRKITKKNFPPDTAAAKAYIEINPNVKKYKQMSEKQLYSEARKIYSKIKELKTNGNKED